MKPSVTVAVTLTVVSSVPSYGPSGSKAYLTMVAPPAVNVGAVTSPSTQAAGDTTGSTGRTGRQGSGSNRTSRVAVVSGGAPGVQSPGNGSTQVYPAAKVAVTVTGVAVVYGGPPVVV